MCQYLSFGPNSPQRGPVERTELAARAPVSSGPLLVRAGAVAAVGRGIGISEARALAGESRVFKGLRSLDRRAKENPWGPGGSPGNHKAFVTGFQMWENVEQKDGEIGHPFHQGLPPPVSQEAPLVIILVGGGGWGGCGSSLAFVAYHWLQRFNI